MPKSLDRNKVAQVLRDGSVALMKTAQERDNLKQMNEKLASENRALRIRMEAEKVAMDMHDRGVHGNVPFADLVDQLEKKAHQDPKGFEVLKEAINLAGPDMLKSASISNNTMAPVGSDFERYILGEVQ